MSKPKDPWLGPAQSGQPIPQQTTEQLHAAIALQQIELAQQKQIITLLLIQLSQLSQQPTGQPPTFAHFANPDLDLTLQPLPENVIDLHEWLDRKYPF